VIKNGENQKTNKRCNQHNPQGCIIMRLVEGQKEKEYKSSVKPLKSSEIEEEKRWIKN
jgi:hypothetical protein